MFHRVTQKEYRRLISNRTKLFCLFLKSSFILTKAWTKLGFEMETVEIWWKLTEIHYFEVEQSKLWKQNFRDFKVKSLQSADGETRTRNPWITKCSAINKKSAMRSQHKYPNSSLTDYWQRYALKKKNI